MILQMKTTKNIMKNSYRIFTDFYNFYNSYRSFLLNFGGSGSGKTIAMLNLIKEQDDFNKICMQNIK